VAITIFYRKREILIQSILLCQLFGVFGKLKGFNQLLYFAIQYSIKVIKCESDTVVSNTALGKIVGPYFGAAVAGAYQAFPVTGDFFFLFSYLLLIQSCAEHLHGLFPVA
jgi:hypothetical protein